MENNKAELMFDKVADKYTFLLGKLDEIYTKIVIVKSELSTLSKTIKETIMEVTKQCQAQN